MNIYGIAKFNVLENFKNKIVHKVINNSKKLVFFFVGKYI